MEGEPQNKKEKESAMSRVVAPVKDMEDIALRNFGDIFRGRIKHPDLEKIKETAKEHDPRLDEIINLINEEMGKFLSSYDLKPLDIGPSKVFILDTPETKKRLMGLAVDATNSGKIRAASGFFNLQTQEIFLFFDYNEYQRLWLAHTLAHEFIHFNSFYSTQFSRDSVNGSSMFDIEMRDDDNPEDPLMGNWWINLRRYGFSIRVDGSDGSRYNYFGDLNEAIVEELTIRFESKHLSSAPILQNDFKNQAEARKEIGTSDPGAIALEIRGPKRFFGLVDGRVKIECVTAYKRERENLNKLIDELYEANKSEYATREDVFVLFANAALNGRLLPLARLMKRTFGKDALRELGEASASKLQNLIKK